MVCYRTWLVVQDRSCAATATAEPLDGTSLFKTVDIDRCGAWIRLSSWCLAASRLAARSLVGLIRRARKPMLSPARQASTAAISFRLLTLTLLLAFVLVFDFDFGPVGRCARAAEPLPSSKLGNPENAQRTDPRPAESGQSTTAAGQASSPNPASTMLPSFNANSVKTVAAVRPAAAPAESTITNKGGSNLSTVLSGAAARVNELSPNGQDSERFFQWPDSRAMPIAGPVPLTADLQVDVARLAVPLWYQDSTFSKYHLRVRK